MLAKVAIGAAALFAASVAFHYFRGGSVVDHGQAESSFGNVWQWQTRRIGTDYAVLIILPAGDQVNMGTFDTKDQAREFAKAEAVRLAKADSGTPPLIGSKPAKPPYTVPGISMEGTPVTPDPIPQAPTPLGFA